MLKQVKDIFKEDALGRLRMISWLHDFEKIENNIYKLKQEIALENNRQKQTTPNPSENKNKLVEEKKSEKILRFQVFFPHDQAKFLLVININIGFSLSIRNSIIDLVESILLKNGSLLQINEIVEQIELISITL